MAKTTTKNIKQSGKKVIPKKEQVVWAPGMPFDKINYILMIIGICIMGLGYYLLSGGGTDDPTAYSESIFDTRRLYVAPIILTIGIAMGFVAIMYRPRKKATEPEEPTNQA